MLIVSWSSWVYIFACPFEYLLFLGTQLRIKKARLYEKMGLSCAVPRILHPLDDFFGYFRCLFGIESDDYMEAPGCRTQQPCNTTMEDRPITNDNGLRDIGTPELEINTVDDCFAGMDKIRYGVRVLIKVINDVPCENPEHSEECQQLMEAGRMVDSQDCELDG